MVEALHSFIVTLVFFLALLYGLYVVTFAVASAYFDARLRYLKGLAQIVIEGGRKDG